MSINFVCVCVCVCVYAVFSDVFASMCIVFTVNYE
jgi:hypothetical protein